MDSNHLRGHINDLRGRLRFLTTLTPDSDRYKLWLGDLVEFVNVAYGPASAEMAALRAALAGRVRPSPEATDAERVRLYLDRVDALAAVLDGYERGIRDPITFFDER